MEDHFGPRDLETRKKRKRHKSKDKKKIDEDFDCHNPDFCDCSEDPEIDESEFNINAIEDPALPKSGASDRLKNRKPLKYREDLANDLCNNDPECLQNDLKILRSFIQNLTTINESAIEICRDKNDSEVPRSTRDRAMIEDRRINERSALKPSRTRSAEKVVQNNSNVTESFELDRSMIYGSSEDKNVDGENVLEHCPLDAGTNAKDEACQCGGDGKESGRTNGSKRRLKDQTVKDEEGISQDFNVNGAELPTIENIDKSSSTRGIIFFTDTNPEDNQFNHEDDKTYACGCEASEEMDASDASQNSDNVDPFCEARHNATRIRKKSFEDLEDEARLIAARTDSAMKYCYCGCAEMEHSKENETYEIENDIPSGNDGALDGNDEDCEDYIEEQTRKLEEEMYSIKAKNDELKKLMKSCYCDEDVNKILALQCAQPAPIRATYSGLTTAIEVLRSKCHTKDRIITALASELRGSKDIDRIAKNLTAPCLRFTYRDFDQCGLYSYLRYPNGPVNSANALGTDKKSVTKSPKENFYQHCGHCEIKNPTNFRVVSDICNCLLVSWNIPKHIRGLRGYEIVINGNVVAARVRNPTRTEAVLGPLKLFGSTEFPESTILTLYAIDSHGHYSELSSIKF